jgi:hypothetical protein
MHLVTFRACTQKSGYTSYVSVCLYSVTAWSFRGFSCCLKVLCALSYVIDIFKDETVKAVTEEQKKAIFSVLSGRDTFVCLQTTVSL